MSENLLKDGDLWLRKWGAVSVNVREREKHLLSWLLQSDFSVFNNKTVLDAGCGIGTNSYHALANGASKVVLLDWSDKILDKAQENLALFKDKIQIVRSNLDEDFLSAKEFDVVMCLGVFNFLRKPRAVLEKLLSAAKPDGELFVWMVGDYNDSFFFRLYKLTRPVFEMAPFFIKKLLAYLLVPCVIIACRVSNNAYMRRLRALSFEYIYEIVLDATISKVRLFSEKEVANLTRGLPVRYYKDMNNMGWTILRTGQ